MAEVIKLKKMQEEKTTYVPGPRNWATGLKFRIAKFESKNFKFEVILEAEFGCREVEKAVIGNWVMGIKFRIAKFESKNF